MISRITLRVRAVLPTVLLLAACRPAPATDPRMVSEWMHALYGAIRVERLSPPVAARLMGYATATLYAGLASVSPKLPSLAGTMNGIPELPRVNSPRDYDGTFIAVAAERVVLDSLLREALPTTRAVVSRLADSLAKARSELGVREAARSRSEELGRQIGIAIVAWSRADGFDATRGRPYVPPVGLANWVNDAPANTYATQNLSGTSELVMLDNPANALRARNSSDRGLILSRPKPAGVKTLPAANMAGATEPFWGGLRPFVLRNWRECPLPDPPPYSTDKGSPLYLNAEVVHSTRLHLTPEQRTIALYWADNAGESGTPVGHWVSIASQMVGARRLSADEAARLMAMTAVAQADAFVAAWGYKYQYARIRPRTYIRRVIDSAWEPLIPTPPFPEYPAGHSTQSAAAAAVLTAFMGDSIAFEDSTGISIGNAARHFDSFGAAANEAGTSRIFGGIHFPYGDSGGRVVGRCVGATVVERFQAARAR